MWSLRPSQCPPCPRLSLLMVWGTWATSHIICRIWFQHCQARTLICPPNSPTCQANSPYTNRSVFLLVIVLSIINQTTFWLDCLCVTRWLLLVDHSSNSSSSSSCHHSNSRRLPRPCPAAQRLSSSPLTESWNLAGLTHYTSPHLWTLMTPSGNASHTFFLLRCDVVAM